MAAPICTSSAQIGAGEKKATGKKTSGF